VFLAGAARSVWTNWNVQDRAAELTTSVVYDRARTGGATGRELPRTSAQVTDELRELLPAAGVPAPYLLVGHSRSRPAAGRVTDHPVLHGDRRVQGSSVGFGDTGHVAMHCRHPGTSSSPTGPARRGDVPIPGRRRLPPRAAPSAEL